MDRVKLFKKYAKHPKHTYEVSETLSVTDDTGRHPDVLVIYSGRDRGKSFEISSNCIADAWYDQKEFIYVRRNDATTTSIEEYFDDKHGFIQDMTDGTRDGITQHRGKLYFYKDEPNEKTGRVQHVIYEQCGKFVALSWRESSVKSLQFPTTFNMLYEEVFTNDVYLPNEPDRLFNLWSTAFRGREGCHMYLISNLVMPVTPYSKAWGLNIGKSKPGEIKLSKLYLGASDKSGKEQYILIASHYLENRNELSDDEAKKKRNRIKTGIASNKWDEATLYPHADLTFIKPYFNSNDPCVVFEWDDMQYLARVINVPQNIIDVFHNQEEVEPEARTMPILYVMRKTTEPRKATRVYTNNGLRLGELITRGFRVVFRLDEVIEDLTKRGHIVGTDNLCMNEFHKVYQNLRLLIK